MSTCLKIACDCKKVTGQLANVSPHTVSRAVCYCAFCRAFHDYLGGTQSRLTTGGVDVFNISPKNVSLDTGSEQLSCVQLSKKGAIRYFSSCCHTPLFTTTPNPKIAMLSVSPVAVPELQNADKRDQIIGPVGARVFGEKASYAHLPNSSRVAVGWFLTKMVSRIIGWTLRGDAKHSPLFQTNGLPLKNPKRLKMRDIQSSVNDESDGSFPKK